MTEPRPLPISFATAGNIEYFAVADGIAELRGWVTHPAEPLTHAAVYLNGRLWQQGIVLHERPDVQSAFPDRPHMLLSGFSVIGGVDDFHDRPHETIIKIAPSQNGREFGYYENRLLDIDAEARRFPLPPRTLQTNVGSISGDSGFLSVSYESTRLLKAYVEKYATLKDRRILDWGCGCGRTARTLFYHVDPASYFGCDVDAYAIQWASATFPNASFTVNPPFPPTQYPDRFFDVIFGLSVMTHLEEQAQLLWLGELARLSARGAIVILSVLNAAQRRHYLRPDLEPEFAGKGEVSFPTYEPHFQQFCPADYYRITLHSVDYIARTWSTYFDLLEYVVSDSHQDLVVMRAR